ncbi:MAG: NAD(P)/FAD-dependent oxidoreductase, partial [Plesiomonas sp.]
MSTMDAQNRPKILIVGGVAGGASAAARARRVNEHAEIIVFERGEYISFANCGLPYHIGGDIPERQSLLLQTPESFKRRFNVDVRVQHNVLSIDRDTKQITVHNKLTGEQYIEHYDKLLLSPGASPIRPSI